MCSKFNDKTYKNRCVIRAGTTCTVVLSSLKSTQHVVCNKYSLAVILRLLLPLLCSFSIQCELDLKQIILGLIIVCRRLKNCMNILLQGGS